MTTDVSGAARDERPGVELEVGITTQDPAVTDEAAATSTEDGEAAEKVTTPPKGGKPIKPDNWMNP